MAIEDEILALQLDQDVFHNEDSKVSGIAKLAVAKGFETLSPAQQSVVRPFLTQPCEGVRDPGGHHNDCQTQLSDVELKEAYEERGLDSLLCENCRDEQIGYQEHWARFSKD
ncbi:Uncharacterised protein [Serratia proteamaculans]|uniref:hypothetical protein n=1 Tax=Serratia proteamaculans TaxID=28151 RepID=UPI0021771881|nr:hypothetical protein [Serratia proteamaculans]CAI0825990.1 Uncharacterised protein [Serratia proteamaculans]CAI1613147.1 Uncharacterised protein [Serratia proteamaculans]